MFYEDIKVIPVRDPVPKRPKAPPPDKRDARDDEDVSKGATPADAIIVLAELELTQALRRSGRPLTA
jgi:hypothetical protein